MGLQLATGAGPAFFPQRPKEATTLQVAQRLMEHPKIIEVKDWILARNDQARPPAAQRYLDRALIEETVWSLQRVLAPKDSLHV